MELVKAGESVHECVLERHWRGHCEEHDHVVGLEQQGQGQVQWVQV
jgi:hypothetical protein